MMATNALVYFVLSAIFCCSTVNGQCGRYITISPNLREISVKMMHPTDQVVIFDAALEKCLAKSASFDMMMYFQYDKAHIQSSHSTIRSRPSPYSYASLCDLNVNVSMAQTCESSNCMEAPWPPFEGLEFADLVNLNNNKLCQFAPNVTMFHTAYGYYGDRCNLSGNPLLFQFKCECNDTYQLTFYQHDGTHRNCVLEVSLFANETDVEIINCTHNGCKEDSFIYDNMDGALVNDFECSNQCTVDSIFESPITTETTTEMLSSTTKSEEMTEDTWFTVGIVFICLFVITLIMTCYMGYKLYNRECKNEGGKYGVVNTDADDVAGTQTAATK